MTTRLIATPLNPVIHKIRSGYQEWAVGPADGSGWQRRVRINMTTGSARIVSRTGKLVSAKVSAKFHKQMLDAVRACAADFGLTLPDLKDTP